MQNSKEIMTNEISSESSSCLNNKIQMNDHKEVIARNSVEANKSVNASSVLNRIMQLRSEKVKEFLWYYRKKENGKESEDKDDQNNEEDKSKQSDQYTPKKLPKEELNNESNINNDISGEKIERPIRRYYEKLQFQWVKMKHELEKLENKNQDNKINNNEEIEIVEFDSSAKDNKINNDIIADRFPWKIETNDMSHLVSKKSKFKKINEDYDLLDTGNEANNDISDVISSHSVSISPSKSSLKLTENQNE